ncbi:hypothetical protein A3Q56_06896 [Intoshia linei]|uniref:Ig-like domain-containing protein n=1 Tax=Intoshia linei TaxID=1819745 RepID=A0A177ATS2_9BILA|nr:hypothetical protein A3Q56_06896 [Intoshia linei]
MTSSKQQIYANIGTTVNLFCNVTGNPIPTIKWLKMTNINLYNEFKIDTMSILLKNVQKSDSNFYKCVASNEIKKNVYRLIELIVQCNVCLWHFITKLDPPDVQLLNSRIGQQQGKTSILKCNIDAVPVPFSVYWEKNDVTLSNDERFKIETTTFENKIILMITINNVQIDDFGFYSCIASNKLGTSLDVVTLYGI